MHYTYNTNYDKQIPQTLFQYFPDAQKQIYPFAFIPYRQPCVSNFLDIKKERLCKISRRLSNIALLILQEIL